MINKISPNTKKPTKNQLIEIINDNMHKINKIEEFYKILTEDNDKSVSLEEMQLQLKNFYNDFLINGKSKKLEDIYQNIIDYKKELFDDNEEKISIKNDIKESQEHITNFYNQCFEGNESTKNKIKNLIDKITNFYNQCFEGNDNFHEKITIFYEKFKQEYDDLFECTEEEKKSKIDVLHENISTVANYLQEIKKQKDDFEKTKNYLQEISADINSKREEINSLLGDATVKVLAQGFIESKEEYSKKQYLPIKDSEEKSNRRKNIIIFFTRHLHSIFYYLLFITPLLLVVSLFIFSYSEEEGLKLTSYSNNIGFEFILYKISITFPLLWISWFAQNSIKERKKLFEEYNHKLRVVQMYQVFNVQKDTYKLNDWDKLENLLLETIGYNPINKSSSDPEADNKILKKKLMSEKNKNK